METITELLKVDYPALFISIFTILIGLKAIISAYEWFINKLGLETKWMREKRKDRELLQKTSESLIALHKKHEEDNMQSDKHDEEIRADLSIFMNEVRTSMSQTQKDIKHFADNRIHDREQSLQIQKDLNNAIKAIADGEKNRDKQISTLMSANMELLGAEIDKRYSRYLKLDGIPETEVGEFDDIYKVYKALGGNHNRDAKYGYVKKHLTVIPVKIKLMNNETNLNKGGLE